MKSILFFISLVSVLFSSDIDYQDKYNKELIKNQHLRAVLKDCQCVDKSDNAYINKGDNIINKVKQGAKWSIGKGAEVLKDGYDNAIELMEKE